MGTEVQGNDDDLDEFEALFKPLSVFIAHAPLRRKSAFTLAIPPIAISSLARIATRTFDAGPTGSSN